VKTVFSFVFILMMIIQNNVWAQTVNLEKYKFRLYPEVNETKPYLPSPFFSTDGREFIIAVTKEDKYAVMPVTAENGRDIYSKIIVDTADFPALAKTGLHSEDELKRLKTITGRPLDKITELGRPNGLSQGGFMAEDEDILSVLKGDNEIVNKMGLNHKILAKALIHVLFMMDNDLSVNRWNMAKHRWENIKYFYYNYVVVSVDAYDTKGGQKSIFDDGIEGAFHLKIWRELTDDENSFLQEKYSHLSAAQFDEMKTLLTFMNAGEIQPQYIMRYGFYEGHTYWRTGPIPIAFIFGFITIEELHKIFPGGLYQVLTEHYTSKQE